MLNKQRGLSTEIVMFHIVEVDDLWRRTKEVRMNIAFMSIVGVIMFINVDHSINWDSGMTNQRQLGHWMHLTRLMPRTLHNDHTSMHIRAHLFQSIVNLHSIRWIWNQILGTHLLNFLCVVTPICIVYQAE